MEPTAEELQSLRYKNLWYVSGRRVVIEALQEKLNNPEERLPRRVEIQIEWRIALNYYEIGDYYKALEILERVCQCRTKRMEFERSQSMLIENGQSAAPTGPATASKPSNVVALVPPPPVASSAVTATTTKVLKDQVNPNSRIHTIAGRCCMALFRATTNHHHLERAYQHYQNAVQTLQMDLSTMFKLPALLLEFSRVMELYGAFDAAMDLYTRILTNFPNYRGYFDAMYRSAIVGRHVSDSLVSPKKENTIDKCIDIMQFLLEALPSTINEVMNGFIFAKLIV